jgi:putative tryptophan/tyrosine transport system substrate-binding protein
MITRRTALVSLASLLAAPLAAEAQRARKLHRIGVLGLSPTSAAMAGPDPQNPFANAFVRGMRELGYTYGQHFVTETRGAEGKPERYPSLVADLVRLQVDAIVAVAASLAAVKQATSTIPIVMTGSEDSVALGHIASLARPGGNITGLSLQLIELTPKRLELLKQLVPTAAPVAVLFDTTGRGYWQNADAAAREHGWAILPLEITDAGELENALRRATAAHASAVIMNAGLLLDAIPRRVAELVASARLPAIYRFPVLRRSGWADVLWCGPRRQLATGSGVRRQDPRGGQNRPTSPSRSRRRSSWPSTSRPPRPSASQSRRHCCCGRIR